MSYKSRFVQPKAAVSFSSVLVKAIRDAGFEVKAHMTGYGRPQIAYAIKRGESATGTAATIIANIEDAETRHEVASAFQMVFVDARKPVTYVCFGPHLEVPEDL